LRGHREAPVAQLAGRPRERGFVDVGKHELAALRAERAGERTAEAGCCSGDDCDAAGEGLHVRAEI
jgi:hypothetical protein